MVLRISTAYTHGKLSSAIFLFADEMAKHMYFGRKEKAILSKSFPDGFAMELDIAQKTQRLLYFQKVYEPSVSNFIRKTLSNGDVFVDVGANVGFYTLLAAKLVGESGHVFAFEPEGDNFSALIKNVRINGLNNVTCLNKAVSKDAGIMTFYVNPLNEGGGSVIPIDAYYDNKERWSQEEIKKTFPEIELTKQVEAITFDGFLEKHQISNVSLAKIDIEGGELDSLLGMKDALRKKEVHKIICEVSDNKKEIQELLENFGWYMYRLDNNGNPHALKELDTTGGKNLLFSANPIQL